MNLKNALFEKINFNEDELKVILGSFEKESIIKGEHIIKTGKTCDKLYYIKEGIFRSYYINESGKDITQWFFNDGKFMTSIESFYQQKPSLYNIQALEDAVVYSINRKKLDTLFNTYPKAERFGRLLAIEMLIKVSNKLNAIQFQKAKERYEYMITEFPNIYYRVPLGYIASYLGMTQETLSRIRKK